MLDTEVKLEHNQRIPDLVYKRLGMRMACDSFFRAAKKLGLSFGFVLLPLAAQTGLGVVRGTVQDTSNAVMPNAKVTLTHGATGTVQTSTTNSAGIYYFGGAPIGPYTLAVEAAGFRKWEGTLTVQ